MDVRSRTAQATGQGAGHGRPWVSARRTAAERKLLPEQIGQILGEWQARELRIARGFSECRGLTREQVEDIYQETTEALYRRPYVNEEHLRSSLRDGIKKRALRGHRDRRKRHEILRRRARDLQLMAEAGQSDGTPEEAVLREQDRLIAHEFTTELSEKEKLVFAGIADGMQYRAITTALNLPASEIPSIRKIARACERKRERFQVLYDTGRLCGFRSSTILALQSGQTTSEELAERAFAHLESCAKCRAEHKTNARRLRESFQGQAAGLLPPLLFAHLGWLTRLAVRARIFQHRYIPETPTGSGALRERAVSLLATGGIGAKAAATVASVALIASGTLATHVLEHPPPTRHHRRGPSTNTETQLRVPHVGLVETSVGAVSVRRVAPRVVPEFGPGHVVSNPQRTRRSPQREPRGLAYLGVPTSTSRQRGPTQTAATPDSSGGAFTP